MRTGQLVPAASVLLAAAVLHHPTEIAAQQRWAIIPTTTSVDHLPRAIHVAEMSAPALEATGAVVLSPERAIALIENTVSRPFRDAPPDLLARLGRAQETALEHVVFGRDQRAINIAESMLAELAPYLSAVGRNEQAARDAANLCFFGVRAYLHRRDRGGAEALALTCLRLRADLRTPDGRLNPPEVVELVERTRSHLDGGQEGLLSIQALPTDPEGCTIRVNGRAVGQTPSLRLATTPGAYEVQVECDPDRIGRVHPIQVAGGEPTRMLVSVRLAQALESRPQVALSYRDREGLEASLESDVAELARVLSVERVLVVVHDGRQLGLRAFERTETGNARAIGGSTVPEPVDPAASRTAVEVALSPPRTPETPPPEQASAGLPTTRLESPEAASATEPVLADSVDLGTTIAGGALVIAGALGLGLSWYAWAELEGRGHPIALAQSPGRLYDAQRGFDGLYPVPSAVGAGASALAIVGLPLLLPSEREVPWWSFAVGGVGVGLVVGGSYLLATPGDCYANGNTGIAEACARRVPNEVAGILMLELAAPFLTVPLLHAIGAALGPSQPERAAVSVGATFGGGVQVSVAGVY